MPRTTTVESPGCPPLRALTFDVLGLVKVIEASDGQNGGAAKMVERWGDPDSSKCVLAASMLDREFDPRKVMEECISCRLTTDEGACFSSADSSLSFNIFVACIAWKCSCLVSHGNGSIEVISAINGDLRAHIPSLCQAEEASRKDDAITGMHLFKNTNQSHHPGHASMESIELGRSPADAIHDHSPTKWNVCASGNILCSKVDENENYALYGGKVLKLMYGIFMNVLRYGLQNLLGIFTPTCFTSATFFSKDDHRKLVAGTDSHQVRLYDISAQRRPVMSVDFRETAIKAVAEDVDGRTIYIGNGSGDLASIDIRTGKLLGCFIGKCSGSIRSIARHPELPVIASCGLDSYLRIWDIKSRQLLSAVFLKQHLTSVVFDSHFRNKEVAGSAPDLQNVNEVESPEQEAVCTKRKKSSKEQ
ncbi:UNVERIFIED_CONTAM: WD repeat-containing protein 74 [Sesamum calycinum]|uniref:WD repeat-containing protein 74 n=1 Tax=Sesamum calycinum TaxID=2727403 RepID=A0AAW2T0D4_9LAMI